MGGAFSSQGPPVDKMGKPLTHIPTKRRLSGQAAVGAFSPSPATMSKMRTRSDFCLLKIFEEKQVLRAFELWCNEEDSTKVAIRYLKFVIQVEKMKEVKDMKGKRGAMFKIFSDFVSKGGADAIPLDGATRETITLGFENKAADDRIFDLGYEKAYQVLKFDFM
jgi:hypothetical protein